jgi:rhodanese-related sulfurtransferase
MAQKENTTVQEVTNTYKIVSVDDFNAALENEEAPQLIDVRTANEFANGSIPNAKNLDLLDGSFQNAMNSLDKNKPVYVFCAVGGRSGKASKLLQENGFTQVVDLKGGYKGWIK